jgi:CDP-diacylglycerol--glycerol-3-phosphate 3-phosphatidyltransferase
MAHAITALRVLLTIPLVLTILSASGLAVWWAAGLFAIIAASDVVDGQVARAAGTVSPWGRVFDHGADIFFVLSTFLAYVWIGVVRWWVPAAVAVAFAVYVVDTQLGTPTRVVRPWAGRVGHLGGICNYVMIGVLIGNETLALHLLPAAGIQLLLAAVPMYSLAAVVVRYWPGSRGRQPQLSP